MSIRDYDGVNVFDVFMTRERMNAMNDNFKRLVDGFSNPIAAAGLNSLRTAHGLADDFYYYVDADLWTLVTSVDGSATPADAAGGKVAIASAAATAGNEAAYLKSTNETFKFAKGNSIFFECLIDFMETDTDKANVIVGLMDNVVAASLQNDGAGPKASYSGMVFFKVDGGTVWQCESSVAGTQQTTATTTTAGGSSQQRLGILGEFPTLTTGKFTYFIDGTQVAQQVDVDVTNATEMQVILGVKDGAVATEETLNVDYVTCYQLR